jgi:hypothetical protein
MGLRLSLLSAKDALSTYYHQDYRALSLTTVMHHISVGSE